MVTSIYCAFVTPSPRFWCWWAFFNSFAVRNSAISEHFDRDSSNNNKSNRCFSTLRTTEVSPTLAIAQILPLINPSTFVGGFSARWHSSWDSKPGWPWSHSFTLIISSSCSVVAILSKGFGRVLEFFGSDRRVERWDVCFSWCSHEEGSTSADACMSCVVPCYTFASIQQKNNKKSNFCANFLLLGIVDALGFTCCLIWVTRSHINGKESSCHDCMVSLCCESCALIKACKTIEGRDADGIFVPNDNPRPRAHAVSAETHAAQASMLLQNEMT